jgi:hypothetical protein
MAKYQDQQACLIQNIGEIMKQVARKRSSVAKAQKSMHGRPD